MHYRETISREKGIESAGDREVTDGNDRSKEVFTQARLHQWNALIATVFLFTTLPRLSLFTCCSLSTHILWQDLEHDPFIYEPCSSKFSCKITEEGKWNGPGD